MVTTRVRLFAVLALVNAAVLLACGDDTEAAPGSRGDAVWAEFLSDDAVRSELPWLAEHKTDLYLAIREPLVRD